MELIRCIYNFAPGFAVLKSSQALASRRFLKSLTISLVCFLAVGTSQAKADFLNGLSELRVGIYDHNVEPGNSEDGVDINVEAIFGRSYPNQPFIHRLLSPAQHFGISVNMSDDTNVVYTGLTWTLFQTDFMFLEATLGGALHDGELKDAIDASYGCRANFRTSGSLGFNLSPSWNLMLTVDHMSNANLCDENRGLTNAGVRLGYRLGG